MGVGAHRGTMGEAERGRQVVAEARRLSRYGRSQVACESEANRWSNACIDDR